MCVNHRGSVWTQDFQPGAASWSLLTLRSPHLPALPFRGLDGIQSQKPLPLGVENDRVFNDLWGKGNVPVVLNNPYSEKEQVRGWRQPGTHIPGLPEPSPV